MVLDLYRATGKIEHFAIGKAETLALAAAGRTIARAGAGIDKPHFLLAERPAQDRTVALPIGRLMNIELVGLDIALHDILAQSPSAGDKDDIAKSGFGVEREDDAARRQIGAHHLHDPNRQRHFEMVEAVVDAIDNGPIGEQRGKAAPARLHNRVLATDIEKAFVLSGKAGVRQIFGRRRTAYRDRNASSAFLLKRAVSGADLGGEAGIAGGFIDDLARRRGAFGQRAYIAMVETGEQPAQRLRAAGLG